MSFDPSDDHHSIRPFPLLSLVILALLSAIALSAEPASLKTRAHDIFQSRCNKCHDSKDDPYFIFDKDGLPCRIVGSDGLCSTSDDPEAKPSLDVVDKVLKAVNGEPGVKHMPPGKGKKLPKEELDLLAEWSKAEREPAAAPSPATTKETKPAPVTPAAPRCQLATKLPTVDPKRPVVSDAEAIAIFGNSCAGCHGKTGTFTSRDRNAGAVALASLTGLAALKGGNWLVSVLKSAKDKNQDQAPDHAAVIAGGGGGTPVESLTDFQVCKLVVKRLVARHPARFVLTSALGLSAAYLAMSQGIKHAHTLNSFQFGDGSLNPAAFAGEVSSLGSIHAQIAAEKMPIPLAHPEDWMVTLFASYPTQEERKKLLTWIEQLQQSDLPKDCEAFPTSQASDYSGAAAACNALGMRLPTPSQAQKLATIVTPKTCVWTTGFSDKAQTPRLVLDKGQLVPVGGEAKCEAVCLR